MYPFDYPHNRYSPRNCNPMPNGKEDDQHSSPHFNYPPYPSTYHPPSYYHYGSPHLPYVQPPPAPLPPYCYPHYYPPCPTYFVPPPPPCNYPMDHHHPCYDDYYKHQNNRTHCCGCSNHMCQPRNDATPSLRIQEEPFNQPERKESDDAMPPSNYAPPIIWRLPSSDSVKANSNINDKYVGKALEKDEVGKKDSQSPSYPVIWLPGNSGFEEMARDKNPAAAKPTQEWPSNFKFVPLKLLENGSRTEPESEVQCVAPAVDKMSNLRTIPVKKVDDGEGNIKKAVEGEASNQSSYLKNIPLKSADNGEDRILEKDIQQEAHDPVEKKGIKVRTIPVKHEESSEKSCKMASNEDKKENKIEGKEESKKSSTSEKKKLSTAKSSKLPPVCLRVDPRPRKTSANSSSTSKSTAAAAASTLGAKNNKESNGGNEEPIREKMMPVKVVNACNQNEPAVPVNTVKENKPSQDEKEQVSEEGVTVASPEKNAFMDDSSKVSEVISEESNVQSLEKSMKENHIKTREQKTNVDAEKAVESTGKIDEKTSSKRVLSETDAATIIQSAYRGFVVRRWQPLEKLKKIAKVRKETENVRRKVDDIEACPPHQLDAKKKVVLGETIMNLLLQLDTIQQGLHPSVKEARKSLAMELTSLEDKLDSIYSRKAKEAESSKCETNIVCSATDTLKLESSEPDSMGVKVTASDAELQTKSDDGAIDVTSSTLVCEAAAHEHDVQVDDNGTKNNESNQKEKLSSSKDTGVEEETNEVVKHPCSERNMDSTVSTTLSSKEPFKPASEEDANLSNVLVHQAEDEHVSLEQDSVNLQDSDTSDSIVGEISTSDAELQGSNNVSLDSSSSGDNAAADVPSSTQHDLQVDDNAIKNLEIVEEDKLQSSNERVEEVKHPSFEREMDSAVSSASVEDVNPSVMLEHLVEDKHVALKEDKVSGLKEEKGHSEKNKETGSIVERPADYIEPNIASDELHSSNDASSRVVESMDGEEETSSAIKANGESILVDNESENAWEAAVVDEDKQVVSEIFDAPRNMEDVCTENVEIDSKSEVFVSNEDSSANTGKEGDEMNKEEVQLMEENESLRKMIEKLVQCGNKQLDVINNLNGRVKDLEKKLQQKKRRMKVRRNRAVKNQSNEVKDN